MELSQLSGPRCLSSFPGWWRFQPLLLQKVFYSFLSLFSLMLFSLWMLFSLILTPKSLQLPSLFKILVSFTALFVVFSALSSSSLILSSALYILLLGTLLLYFSFYCFLQLCDFCSVLSYIFYLVVALNLFIHSSLVWWVSSQPLLWTFFFS